MASAGNAATDSPLADRSQPDTQLTIAPGVKDQQFVGPLADAYRRLDPSQDGWQSEAIGQAIQDQLNQLAAWMRQSPRPSKTDLSKLVDRQLVMDELCPSDARIVFQRDSLTVTRGESAAGISDGVGQAPSQASHPPADDNGAETMHHRLSDLANRFATRHPDHVKFKLIRVDPRDTDVDTQIHFHADGKSADGLLELSSTWRCRWTSADSDKPRLAELHVEDFEMVELGGRLEPLFADCTASLLAMEPVYHAQILRSTDYWRSRICRDLGLDVVANHGLALGDVNGDMLDDVYLCQQGGLTNRLFLQRQDGTLADATSTSGTDWLDYCASALIVDLNNDGRRDLVVGQEIRILIMENVGDARFRLAREIPTAAQVFSLSAADYDLDGDLDVFVCGYNPMKARARTGAMGEPIPYHDAQNGGENMLLRNDGNWQLVDAAPEVGLNVNNNRFSFAASWEDYDNDGDVDLYVANDYGRNNLYRNDEGHFQDVAAELGVEDMSAGMSVSWADFNRDGWMDFYVSNMFSAAGNRITYQRQFQTAAAQETKQEFQRHARGNSLFANNKGRAFRDVSVNSRVTLGRWAWGNRFVDFNNDGWEDLVVANGFITTEDTGDL